MKPTIIMVTWNRRGYWLVSVVPHGGEGVSIWSRKAKTPEEVRARLERAAQVRRYAEEVK